MGAVEAGRVGVEPVSGILARGALQGLGWARATTNMREREVRSGIVAGTMGWVVGAGNKREPPFYSIGLGLNFGRAYF